MEAFRNLPPPMIVNPSFMEISGYPHYENVCSNILAFFLNPASPHGLGTLCLDALLEAANCSAETIKLSGVQVEREVEAGSGRLDILIFSDNLVIALENKLFAALSNPLSEYGKFVERLAEQRHVLKLVLSLAPLAINSEGFVGLTYDKFFGTLRSKLGHYTSRANARYILYLTDFLDTIDDLQRGTLMDTAWLEFSRENRKQIESLLMQVKTLQQELRNKVQELMSNISFDNIKNIKPLFLWRDPTELRDILGCHIDAGLYRDLTVDTIVSPEGWEIRIWIKGRGDPVPSALIALLDRAGIRYAKLDSQLTYAEQLPYDAAIATVQYHLKTVVEKIVFASLRPQSESA